MSIGENRVDLFVNDQNGHVVRRSWYGAQAKLEADYKRELGAGFGIEFDHLFTITNMPIQRFAADLERSGKQQEYMGLLVNHFNPTTVAPVTDSSASLLRRTSSRNSSGVMARTRRWSQP